MATLQDITAPVWGMSIKGPGVIVQGVASLRQCLDLIIRTTQGTDPMRPEFGSNVYAYQDAPLNVAIPNIKKEILEAVALWETRVSIVRITHYIKEAGNPVFEIFYQVTNEEIIDKLTLDLQAGTITGAQALNELIISAGFPDNPNNYRYNITLERNGTNLFPRPNPDGFATVQEMFSWAQANWYYVGKWYLLTDKIVCYMNADGVTSASLSISVLPIIRFECAFPVLDPGKFYNVSFKANGVAVTPAMPHTYTTPGEVLAAAKAIWNAYDWILLYDLPGGGQVFSDEFSDEFDTPGTGYFLIGISHEIGFVGELLITTV